MCMQDIEFSPGKPVAAITIYKCLLHWKSFECERTSVFDRLIQMIGSAIEEGFRSIPASANLNVGVLDIVRQVEAKYPALLFKQQLTAYVEKIYEIVRDNLKKDLSSFLSICIQAPRTSKGAVLRASKRSFGNNSQASHWYSIIDSLTTFLTTLQQNFVPPVLMQKIFTQTFLYINVQLFNSLLLRRECCTFSNGEYVKAGLAELELWCAQAKEEYTGSSWDELKHIRQAVGFLVNVVDTYALIADMKNIVEGVIEKI